MAEFNTEYTEAYRTDLTEMLDLAEELPLIYQPSESIHGNPYSKQTTLLVEGRELESYNPDTPEGAWANRNISEGLITLHSFSARAMMFLTAAGFPDYDPGTQAYTPEQQRTVDERSDEVMRRVTQSEYAYNSFRFVTDDKMQFLTVASYGFLNHDETAQGRGLTLSSGDELMIKQLWIEEIRGPYSGGAIMNVNHTVTPAQNESLRQAVAFFDQYDLTGEGLAAIMHIYTTELQGRTMPGAEALETLRQHFTLIGARDRLEVVLEMLKHEAATTKSAQELEQSNPEINLPTAAELAEYKDLLSSLRA